MAALFTVRSTPDFENTNGWNRTRSHHCSEQVRTTPRSNVTRMRETSEKRGKNKGKLYTNE